MHIDKQILFKRIKILVLSCTLLCLLVNYTDTKRPNTLTNSFRLKRNTLHKEREN